MWKEAGNKALGPSISATPTAQVKPLTRFLDVPSILGNTWKHAGNKALVQVLAQTRFLDVPNTRGNIWKQAKNKVLGPSLPRRPHKSSP